MLADQLVDALLVLFAGKLDQEIAGVHLEHARQQIGIVDVGAVGRIAIAAGASMDADILALGRREPVDDPVVELDEPAQHLAAGPRIARIVAAGEPPLGKVDRHARGARLEAHADVLLALVAQILEERLARIAFDLAVERIEQRQHRGRDHRLFQRLGRHLLGLFDIAGGEGLVAERPAGQARQLAMMAVGEDGEILAVRRRFSARPVPAKVSVMG